MRSKQNFSNGPRSATETIMATIVTGIFTADFNGVHLILLTEPAMNDT